MLQVADNLWMGSGTVVNWVVIRDGSDLTLIDTGWPGDFAKLQAAVAATGLSTAHIRAVLLTHTHIDHMGGVNALWRKHGTPVFMHPDEIPLALGGRSEQATPKDVILRSWRPRTAMWGVRTLTVGGLQKQVIPHAQAWNSDGPLDVPGRPIPIACPGHTSGHCAYYFPHVGVIATGDSLVTGHPVTGKSTPHLLPAVFNASTDRARISLEVFRDLDADIVLPGHGPMWSGPIRSAVDVASEAPSEKGRWR